jgi:hypothetical protein
VASQLLRELTVLLHYRKVQILTKPLRQRSERPIESTFRRLPFDHPRSLPGSAPVMGESQKVECRRFGGFPSLSVGVARLGRLEPHQTRLLRVDCQSVLAHPLGQNLHDPPGVIFSGYPDHEVIRVTNQESFSLQARANLRLEPFVQHVVQENVGQERTDHAPNNVAKNPVGGLLQKGMG